MDLFNMLREEFAPVIRALVVYSIYSVNTVTHSIKYVTYNRTTQSLVII